MQLDNVENFYPLSPLQQGLLFHSLTVPEARMYYNQMTATLNGPLEVSAFTRAWQRVVDHHPILRTFFVWDGLKEPIQVVDRQAELPFAYYDWREIAASERQTKLETVRRADLKQGFDLAKAPLMRVVLMQTAEDCHELLWSFHHILMDGWSMFRVLKEVFGLYEALRQGSDLRLESYRPYRDYVAWLRRQDAKHAEKFWRRSLKGFTAPTPLVVDRMNGKAGAAEFHGSREEEFAAIPLFLSEETTTALKTMAQKNHLTLNTLALGAWGLLLSRYSGERDVVFGAIVSGRPAALTGVDAMVGLFINMLPVRVIVSPALRVRDWLRQLQAYLVEMREYEYSPLVDVQGWSEAPRGAPFFESFFLFENYRKDLPLEAMAESLALENICWHERTNYPLMVLAVPETQMLLRLTYQRSRFDAATIARMLGHWRMLLEAMAADPNARLAELPLLTPEEKRQMLIDWNDTKRDYPEEKCFPQHFEAQAARAPDAVAVVFEDRQLTYHELNHRATQLAQHLSRRCGIGPEVLVGICMERSLEMLIALLAVMKAGGAYVPLDPAFPKERLEFMLQDAQVQVLLSQRLTINNCQLSIDNCQLICLDADWPVIAQQNAGNIESPASPENLAYVIYTSGSTGKPKGVMISHRALVNFLTAMQREPGLHAHDVLLAVTTLSFDIAGLELYLPLLAGACVDIASREVSRDATKLVERLKISGATVMQATPATWRMLLEVGWQGEPRLKILAGGEALPRELADKLHGKCAALWNMYGPTETTIWSTTNLIQKEEHTISIGRPIANTGIYILDAQMQPVPIGVAGDLYLGGAGVARGYLNRPDLTAEKFIPISDFGFWISENENRIDENSDRNPQSEIRNCLYCTGDLAKYLEDGKIEFLGRNDFQVKLRGFRIELGDIEFTLAQHPSVQQAVAHVREDAPGDKRLVAYIVARSVVSDQLSVFSNQYPVNSNEQPTTNNQQPTTSNDLRAFLLDKLPEYMIPSAFVFMKEMPLTPNGKVNRKALPPPESTRAHVEASYVAPRTEIERTLAAIWKEVLRVEQVGLHDNFFDLGGHSLLMTQVYSRIRRAFEKEITMMELFRYPTISAMAKHLSAEPELQVTVGGGEERAALRRAAMQRRVERKV